MEENRRRMALASAIVITAVLCLIVWNGLFGEKELAVIDLPSGDTIAICYRSPKSLTAAIMTTGGLRYRIYSDKGRTCGWLTGEYHYDVSTDVNLRYEVLGPRSVGLKARDHPGWIISGDSAGEYHITHVSGEAPADKKESETVEKTY